MIFVEVSQVIVAIPIHRVTHSECTPPSYYGMDIGQYNRHSTPSSQGSQEPNRQQIKRQFMYKHT